MNNSQAGTPGWMMLLACLLMAAIVSGMVETSPSSRSSTSNVVSE